MYEFLELYDEKGLKRIKEGDILLEKKCSSTEYLSSCLKYECCNIAC